MAPTYTDNLSLKIRTTNVRAQKIDGFIFKIFGMALASLKIKNKLNPSWSF